MVAMRVTVTGIPELKAALERMNPGQNKRILRNSLLSMAYAVQKNATQRQIRE